MLRREARLLWMEARMADVHEKVVAEVAKIGQTQPNFSILDKTQPVTVQFAPSLAEFVPTLTSFDAISAQPPPVST